jgi:hypothetical protein
MKKIKQPSLIRENHPASYKGYEFITLIKFNGETYLNIVDNVVNNNIVSYVIDLCEAMSVDEIELVGIANEWYHNSKDKHPLSIEISKRGLSQKYNSIQRCFPIDYITRVIGPIFTFNMGPPKKVKRKKRKVVQKHIEILKKTV